MGDSPINYGTQRANHQLANHQLADDRLSAVAIPAREHYVSQLRAGLGYSPEHLAALVALQRARSHARNRASGYWIAETDSDAATTDSSAPSPHKRSPGLSSPPTAPPT